MSADGGNKEPGAWVLALPQVQRLLKDPPIIREMTVAVLITDILNYLVTLIETVASGRPETDKNIQYLMMLGQVWQDTVSQCRDATQEILLEKNKHLVDNDSLLISVRRKAILARLSCICAEMSMYKVDAALDPVQYQQATDWANKNISRVLDDILSLIPSQKSSSEADKAVLLNSLIARNQLLLMPFLNDQDYLCYVPDEVKRALFDDPLVQKYLHEYMVMDPASIRRKSRVAIQGLLKDLRYDCLLLRAEVASFEPAR